MSELISTAKMNVAVPSGSFVNLASTSTVLKRFELDPAILYHVFYSQAGSIAKSVIELVMNSSDAQAHVAHIVLSCTGFEIRDDGHGFQSEAEIDRVFGTFGTPHVEGDVTFGRFRIGRAQCMGHAKTRWRSNFWQMDVDIKNRGDGYEFSALATPVAGCEIIGTWYEPLEEQEWLSTMQELQDLVRYTPLTVTLNGKPLTRNPAAEKWDFEDEYAYYRVRREGAMAIYNQGVLVRFDAGHVWGVGGAILSKQALALDMSRTEVLRKTCRIWKEASRVMKGLASVFLQREDPRRRDENGRRLSARVLLQGGVDALPLFSTAQVVTLLPGKRQMTLKQFLSLIKGAQLLACVPGHAHLPRAEMIAGSGAAVLVHPDTLVRFDAHDPLELEAAMVTVALNLVNASEAAGNDARQHIGWWELDRLKGFAKQEFATYDTLSAHFVERTEVLPEKELKSAEVRRAWQALRWCIQQYAARVDGHERNHAGGVFFDSDRKPVRHLNVLVGRSNRADAWTDGASYIAIHIDHVNALALDGIKAAAKIMALVDHELSHSGDSLEAVHDEAFRTRYHDLSIEFASERQFYLNKWLVKYARSHVMEGKWASTRYGWAGNALMHIDRISAGRRKTALPGLLDDVEAESVTHEDIASVPPTLLARVNAELSLSGKQPPMLDAQEILATSAKERVEQAEELRKWREEEAQFDASIEEMRTHGVAALLEIEVSEVEESHTRRFGYLAEVFNDHSVKAAVARLDRRLIDLSDDEIASLECELMQQAYGEEPEEPHGDGSEDDEPAEGSELSQQAHAVADSRAVEYARVNGRMASNQAELDLWYDIGRPALPQHLDSWAVQRNAAAVGLWVSDYLATLSVEQSGR